VKSWLKTRRILSLPRKDVVRTCPNEGVTALRLRKRGAKGTCVCLLVYVSPYLRHISKQKVSACSYFVAFLLVSNHEHCNILTKNRRTWKFLPCRTVKKRSGSH